MNYSQLIRYLYNLSQFGGIKLGLQNVQTLAAGLGNPHQQFKSIHVAGTNGKGTVTKKIAAALIDAGYKTGHYTSPHLSCFRERIRINDIMIPEQDVEKLLPQIIQEAEKQKIKPTFFEITTLLAFHYFAHAEVDFVVLETGLGGSLDATNIVTPCLSIITSISLEHTDLLGDTIEKIATEKAGIIKSQVPVILGPNTPQPFLQDLAQQKKAPCISVQGVFDNFIEENTAIAKTALQYLKVPLKSIENGLLASLSCRFEELTFNGATILLDVAHNPDGIQRLCQLIKMKYPHRSVRAVCGFSKNKDIPSILKILKDHVSVFHLVEAPNGRGESVSQLHAYLKQLQIPSSNIHPESQIASAVAHALQEMASPNELLVICGTFFIMSDARAALGIQEPRDPTDLNESSQIRSPHIKTAHQAWKEIVKPGDCVIDATCGNGNDTLVLATLLNTGTLYALDIQAEAISKTKEKLDHSPHSAKIHLLQQCHSRFPTQLKPKSIKLIVYNLGYLPKGNKKIITTPKTTLNSLSEALNLIMPGGAISITCYPGHPGGKEEESAIVDFTKQLLKEEWNVQNYRWKENPTSPSLIFMKKSF